MTAWEYGYIYVVHTVGPAPAVCIVIDSSKPRVLDGCHGLLRAANILQSAHQALPSDSKLADISPVVAKIAPCT